jgi:hypothetical protein
LAQSYPEAIFALLARHHPILNQAICYHHGYTFQIVEDSFSVAYHHASDALLAALDIQSALLKQDWSPTLFGYVWAFTPAPQISRTSPMISAILDMPPSP